MRNILTVTLSVFTALSLGYLLTPLVKGIWAQVTVFGCICAVTDFMAFKTVDRRGAVFHGAFYGFMAGLVFLIFELGYLFFFSNPDVWLYLGLALHFALILPLHLAMGVLSISKPPGRLFGPSGKPTYLVTTYPFSFPGETLPPRTTSIYQKIFSFTPPKTISLRVIRGKTS